MIETIETRKEWYHPSKLMDNFIGLSLNKTYEKGWITAKNTSMSWIMLANSKSSMNGLIILSTMLLQSISKVTCCRPREITNFIAVRRAYVSPSLTSIHGDLEFM